MRRMFRTKAGARLIAAVAIAVRATYPHVSRHGSLSVLPKSIVTIGSFQFTQQYQPRTPARTTARDIALARSAGESFQILNARDAATESRSSIWAGGSALLSDSSNFKNFQSAPPDLSRLPRACSIPNSVIR